MKYVFLLNGERVEQGVSEDLDFILKEAEAFCKKHPYETRSFEVSKSDAIKPLSAVFDRNAIEEFLDFAAF